MSAAAQPALHDLEKLTMADGLSSNMVRDVVQDGDGFLWIATDNGLNRYDGTEIRNFYAEHANPHALPDNDIHRLILLDSFHLAIATSQGLSILDTRRLIFQHLYFTLHDLGLPEQSQPEERLSAHEMKLWEAYHNVVLCMEKDASGNLWLGTRASLLCLDRHLHLIHVFYRHIQPHDLYGRRLRYVWKIIPSAAMRGNLVLLNTPVDKDSLVEQAYRSWFLCRADNAQFIPIDSLHLSDLHFLSQLRYENQCFQVYKHYLLHVSPTRDSLYLWDEYTGRKAVCKFLNARIWNGNQLIPWPESVSDIGNGWIFFAYETQGFSLIRLRDQHDSLSLVFYPQVYFPQHTFRKIFIDREENWWMASEMEGLFKISPDKQNFESIEMETGNKRHEIVSMYRYKNKLFIANYGNGLYCLDLTTQKITHFLFSYTQNKLLNQLLNMVWNVRHQQGDTCWVGTQMGLMWFNMSNHHAGRLLQTHPGVLDTAPITTQFTDSKGLVWMGLGLGHGLCVYDPYRQIFQLIPNRADGFPFRYPVGIAEDKNTDIWMVSDDIGSLVHWSRKNHQFKVVTPQILKDRVSTATGAICVDHQNCIWYAVDPVGVIRYNPRNQQTSIFGPEDGLNIGTVRSIMQDGNDIWFATTQGIRYYDLNHHTFTHFTEPDRLPTSYLTGIFFKDSLTHVIYLGTLGGIIKFNPDRLIARSSPLSVRIIGVFINNILRTDIDGHEFHVPYRNNDIAISFTGINLTHGKDNVYAYRLDKGNRKSGSWMYMGHQREIRLANLAPGSYHLYIRAASNGNEWSPDIAHMDFMVITPFTRSIWFYMLLVFVAMGVVYGWYRYRMFQLVKLEYMRNQISHDLHDEIGSYLTTISLTALLAQEKLKQEDARQTREINQLNDLLRKIAEDSHLVSETMREIVWTINPRNDSFAQTIPFLIRYASQVLESANIEIDVMMPDGEDIKMNMYEKRDLVLIFKEVIHNIVKHAGATRVQIVCKKKHNMFSLLIADDGKGFNTTYVKDGNGLYNMKERANRHNWLIEIDSSPTTGTRVMLYFKST